MNIFLPLTLGTAIFLSACTIEQKNGELQSELHPPLTYAQWRTESYKTTDGQPVCAVSSGYNGLSVLLHRKGDAAGVSVKSNRTLVPGAFLSVNVNGHRYQTRQEFFSGEESPQLATDLAAGGKAYLEWSEPHPHHGRRRFTNILKLDDFAPQFEQCEKENRYGNS